MVNITCEKLFTLMTPVVQVRDVPDPINKKRLGSGQKYQKKFESFDQPIEIVSSYISFFVLLVPKQLFIDASVSKVHSTDLFGW